MPLMYFIWGPEEVEILGREAKLISLMQLLLKFKPFILLFIVSDSPTLSPCSWVATALQLLEIAPNQ